MSYRLFCTLLACALLFAACADDPDAATNQANQDLADVYDDAGDLEDVDDRDSGENNGQIIRDLPLDEFVADDSDFEYDVAWADEDATVPTWLLEVTSQRWRSDDEVDRTLWQHQVVLAVPDGADTSTALVIITGGSNNRAQMEPDDGDVELAQMVANLVGTPVVGLAQIPNQPLTIYGEGEDMFEDDLVASSWHMVLETGDSTWSAYFPMTRAVVRTMDAVQDFMDQRDTPTEDFVLTGFSKRGATTYLATAADERVIAMAPGVFDFLNFRPQARHHLDVYGEPAPAVADYAAYDLLNRVEDEEAQVLIDTSDPYAYRDRFTMPKLILASPGDQFFLPDAMRFYIDDIPGETLVRYIPNSGHGLVPEGSDLMDSLIPLVSWYQDIVADRPRPEISWTHDDGVLTIHADPTPPSVRLWTATNEEEQNFRIDVLGPVWESTAISGEDNTYTATVDPPEQGYTAYLLEVSYGTQIYTTQVYVTP